jgi:ABC-type enterochelin transport system substrate-binding protein
MNVKTSVINTTFITICLLLLLVGCSSGDNTYKESEALITTPPQTQTPAPSTSPVAKPSPSQTSEAQATTASEESGIDTSVFVYAEKVVVTDARDITDHIDLVVHMSEKPTPGLATQHVLTQTYDFLQQKDIQGAKTITIGVMQGDLRISQFTIDVAKFKPTDHLIKSVLAASTIDKMNDEVKEFGKTMELW